MVNHFFLLQVNLLFRKVYLLSLFLEVIRYLTHNIHVFPPQDNLCRHAADLVRIIENEGGIVYVCGDATNMARNVNQAFIQMFHEQKGTCRVHQTVPYCEIIQFRWTFNFVCFSG